MVRITCLDDVIRHYFMSWEIEEAQRSPDPVAELVSFMVHSQRGAASPDGYLWEVRVDRFQAWFNHRPWTERPDVSLSLAAFARRAVDVLIKGANQLRMEIV